MGCKDEGEASLSDDPDRSWTRLHTRSSPLPASGRPRDGCKIAPIKLQDDSPNQCLSNVTAPEFRGGRVCSSYGVDDGDIETSVERVRLQHALHQWGDLVRPSQGGRRGPLFSRGQDAECDRTT